MKKKTKLFSLLGLTLLFSVGLIGCGSKKPEENPGGGGENPPAVETQINVTAAENKTTLLIGETVQMSADVEGVKWSSTDTEVATVSSAGLVTAVKVGSTKIRAAKDGYKTGSLSITVERATNSYALVDGKTTRLELEDGAFENTNGYWGYPQYGMVPNHDGGETPIEDTDSASGGMSLGYIDASTKITMVFTAPAAGKVEMTLCAAYANEVDLEKNFTLKINNIDVDLAGAVVPAGGSNNYYAWSEINLGEANVIEGKNTLVFECIGSGVNLDYIDMKFTAGGTAQVLPKITPTEASYALEVGATQQITADVEGLSYASSDEAVATVSDTGLITAVAAGNAVITLSKEGYKDAKVAVKVTAKVEPIEHDDYVLEDGKTTRLELEYGEFYSPTGSWGMDYWGQHYGPNHDGGVTPIEDEESASNKMSLGYITQGTKITMKFTAPAAGTVELTLGAAYASAVDLGANFTLTINEVAVDLTGKEVPAASDGSSYYEWATIALGSAAVKEGENVLVLECIGSGANLDYIDATFDANGQVTPPDPVDPVEEEFVVSVPSVADLARLELVNDVPCYIMKITFTGEFDANAKFELFDGERVLPFVKAELLAEAGNAELYFNMSSLEDGAAQFYPHLKVDETPWNGTDGNVQAWQVFPDGDQLDGAIVSGNNKYYIKGAWGMPSIMVIDNLPDAEGVVVTGAKVELAEDKAIFTLSGTSTANMSAKKIKIDAQFCGGMWPTTNFANPTVVIKEDGSWTLSVDVTALSAGSYVIHVYVNGAKYGAGDGNLDLSLTEEQATSATIGSTLYEVKQLTPAPWGDGTITGLVISAVA